MITNLLGRQVKTQYAHSDTYGTIVAVYLERGELMITIENPEGGLYTMNAGSASLEPNDNTAAWESIAKKVGPSTNRGPHGDSVYNDKENQE